MLNYKSFIKTDLDSLAKRYGFESVDDDAFVRVVLVMEVLVFNLLNNVKHMASSLNMKSIGKGHFMAVMKIMNEVTKQQATSTTKQNKKLQSGGKIVMPSEYYGIDSGRYTADTSAFNEQSAFADGVSRAAIVQQSAGGANDCFIGKKQIKFLVDEYKREKKAEFSVSSSAYEIITTSLWKNLQVLLAECRKYRTRKGLKKPCLSLNIITNVLVTKLEHMSYSWKVA